MAKYYLVEQVVEAVPRAALVLASAEQVAEAVPLTALVLASAEQVAEAVPRTALVLASVEQVAEAVPLTALVQAELSMHFVASAPAPVPCCLLQPAYLPFSQRYW